MQREYRFALWLLAGVCACDDGSGSVHDAGARDADAQSEEDFDAGKGADGLIDAGCAHYSTLSGLCDDPAVIAHCETLGVADCAANGCRAVSARALAPTQHCLRGYQFAGCTLSPEGCSTVFTYAFDRDGGAWLLNDSCRPTSWMLAPLAAFADAGTWTDCPSP